MLKAGKGRGLETAARRLEDGDGEHVRGVQALAPHEGGGGDLRKIILASFYYLTLKIVPRD